MITGIPVSTPSLKGNELKYLKECIDSGWISSEGPFVKQFEDNFSKYIGRQYGVAVANGSAALDIAVHALDLKAGDEVIMPAFTIISPALSVVRAGAVPVLIDSEADTWSMDVSQIEAKITPRTKAIIVVHIYGLPADILQILKIAKTHDLKVIEDAAEMIGQQVNDRHCGSFGLMSIFSFYSNKHITTGEGGMVLTDDPNLANRCKKLRNLAFENSGPRFVHYEMGWNYRMTNLQAALGIAQLEQLDQFIVIKRGMGEYYQERLSFLQKVGFLLPVRSTKFSKNIYWVFGIVAPNEQIKDALTAHLSRFGIGWRPFFWCMHEQPVFQQMALFKNERYPVAESLARCGFYIPGGLALTQENIEYVCSVVKDFFAENG